MKCILRYSPLPSLIALVFSLPLLSGCDGSGADIHYTALGASDAVGVGADPITDGYVYRIEDRLEERGKDTALNNLGIPGADTDDIRESSLQLAKDLDPDLITIFVGANDLVDGVEATAFEEDLKEILKELTDSTDAFIVIGTLPDVTKAPRFVDKPNINVTSSRLQAFNEAILRQAQSYNVAVADLRDSPVDAEVTAGDGYHPNAQGYKIIAEQFLKIIEPHFF